MRVRACGKRGVLRMRHTVGTDGIANIRFGTSAPYAVIIGLVAPASDARSASLSTAGRQRSAWTPP
jgi:hypothetical protein